MFEKVVDSPSKVRDRASNNSNQGNNHGDSITSEWNVQAVRETKKIRSKFSKEISQNVEAETSKKEKQEPVKKHLFKNS